MTDEEKIRFIDQVNTIALAALNPGPAAFWHQYLWTKIHMIHASHTQRGLYGADMGIVPKAMIREVCNEVERWNARKEVMPGER